MWDIDTSVEKVYTVNPLVFDQNKVYVTNGILHATLDSIIIKPTKVKEKGHNVSALLIDGQSRNANIAMLKGIIIPKIKAGHIDYDDVVLHYSLSLNNNLFAGKSNVFVCMENDRESCLISTTVKYSDIHPTQFTPDTRVIPKRGLRKMYLS